LDVGNIIKNRRQEIGLTLEKVGEAVGVGKSTVRKWESGQIKDMRRDKIAALAKVLRISPAVLIFGEETVDFESNVNMQNFRTFSEDTLEVADLYEQLDDLDRAEIRGEIKGMLKNPKYQPKNKEVV